MENKERLCMVYGYRNTIDNKWYIGECYEDRERERKTSHKSSMKKYERTGVKCGCHKFYVNVIKYGTCNFEKVYEYRVLEKGIPLEQIYTREEYWSDTYNSIEKGYNIRVGKGTKNYIGDSIKGDNHHKAVPLITYETKPITKSSFIKACKIRQVDTKDFIELLCKPEDWEVLKNRATPHKTFNYIHKNNYDENIHIGYDRTKVNFKVKDIERFETTPSLRQIFLEACKTHNLNPDNYIKILAEKERWYHETSGKGTRRTFYFIHKEKYISDIHKDKERVLGVNIRDIEEYSFIPTTRSDFKRICKKRKWNIDDFIETITHESLWKDEFNYQKNKTYLRKRYFYSFIN